jgi:hypothetical protein
MDVLVTILHGTACRSGKPIENLSASTATALSQDGYIQHREACLMQSKKRRCGQKHI